MKLLRHLMKLLRDFVKLLWDLNHLMKLLRYIVKFNRAMTNRRSFGHESNLKKKIQKNLNLNIWSRHGALLQCETLYTKPYQITIRDLCLLNIKSLKMRKCHAKHASYGWLEACNDYLSFAKKDGRAYVSDNRWIWCKFIGNHFSKWPVHWETNIYKRIFEANWVFINEYSNVRLAIRHDPMNY